MRTGHYLQTTTCRMASINNGRSALGQWRRGLARRFTATARSPRSARGQRGGRDKLMPRWASRIIAKRKAWYAAHAAHAGLAAFLPQGSPCSEPVLVLVSTCPPDSARIGSACGRLLKTLMLIIPPLQCSLPTATTSHPSTTISFACGSRSRFFLCVAVFCFLASGLRSLSSVWVVCWPFWCVAPAPPNHVDLLKFLTNSSSTCAWRAQRCAPPSTPPRGPGAAQRITTPTARRPIATRLLLNAENADGASLRRTAGCQRASRAPALSASQQARSSPRLVASGIVIHARCLRANKDAGAASLAKPRAAPLPRALDHALAPPRM